MEKRICETLVDEAGVEIRVTYYSQKNSVSFSNPPPYENDSHYIYIEFVEVIIAKKSIDIKKLLDEKQIETIIDNLQEYDY